MNSKGSLITGHQPSPAEDSGQTVARDEGEINKKNQGAYVPGHDTRIEQAELRTEQVIHASELSYRRLHHYPKLGCQHLVCIPDNYSAQTAVSDEALTSPSSTPAR